MQTSTASESPCRPMTRRFGESGYDESEEGEFERAWVQPVYGPAAKHQAE